MSDSLRDRIATVIYHAASQWDAHPWDALAGHIQALYLGQADAVLEELKLRRETVGLIHRYVTNWLPEAASYCNRCGIPHSTPCKRPADA